MTTDFVFGFYRPGLYDIDIAQGISEGHQTVGALSAYMKGIYVPYEHRRRASRWRARLVRDWLGGMTGSGFVYEMDGKYFLTDKGQRMLETNLTKRGELMRRIDEEVSRV